MVRDVNNDSTKILSQIRKREREIFFNYHATRYPGLEISIKFETIAIKWCDTRRKIRIRPFSQFQRHSLFLFLDIHRPGLLYRSRLAFQA